MLLCGGRGDPAYVAVRGLQSSAVAADGRRPAADQTSGGISTRSWGPAGPSSAPSSRPARRHRGLADEYGRPAASRAVESSIEVVAGAPHRLAIFGLILFQNSSSPFVVHLRGRRVFGRVHQRRAIMSLIALPRSSPRSARAEASPPCARASCALGKDARHVRRVLIPAVGRPSRPAPLGMGRIAGDTAIVSSCSALAAHRAGRPAGLGLCTGGTLTATCTRTRRPARAAPTRRPMPRRSSCCCRLGSTSPSRAEGEPGVEPRRRRRSPDEEALAAGSSPTAGRAARPARRGADRALPGGAAAAPYRGAARTARA